MVTEFLKARLRRFRLYRAARFAWHVATDRVFRRDQGRRLRPAPGQFQYRSLTRSDRYPVVFAFVRDQLAGPEPRRLLSFGCATGEEVWTLRRYFPPAYIKGIDVSAGNIATCERECGRRGVTDVEFVCASSGAGEVPESYDAIFCMAVFQHSELDDPVHESCARFIRFEDFEATLAGLARALKPGGLLAIRNSHFRFEDSACARDFRPVLRIGPHGAPRPRFDRDNQRLPDAHDADVVWRKLPEPVRG